MGGSSEIAAIRSTTPHRCCCSTSEEISSPPFHPRSRTGSSSTAAAHCHLGGLRICFVFGCTPPGRRVEVVVASVTSPAVTRSSPKRIAIEHCSRGRGATAPQLVTGRRTGDWDRIQSPVRAPVHSLPGQCSYQLLTCSSSTGARQPNSPPQIASDRQDHTDALAAAARIYVSQHGSVPKPL